MEVAFTTAVTGSPSRRRISSCDCRVTMAVEPEAAIERHARQRPFGDHRDNPRRQMIARAGGMPGGFRSMVTLSARMQANTSAPGPPMSTATRRAAPISTVTRPALLRHHARRADGFHAHRRGHLRIRRAIEHALHRAGLAQFAVDHDGDRIAQRQRLDAVVRHHDGGHLHAGQQLPQIGAHAQPRGRIERRERLVQQQQTGLRRQRARQRHALQLAARKLPRIAVRQFAQFEARQQTSSQPSRARRRRRSAAR